jgi:hypothetical protein
MKRHRTADLDHGEEMMWLATEVADGMAATAAFAAMRLSDRAARLGRSLGVVLRRAGEGVRARPLLVAAAVATIAGLAAWRWSR